MENKMFTTELYVNANNKKELLTLAKKNGVTLRKDFQGQLEIRNEIQMRYVYKARGHKASVILLVEQADRMFEAKEGGNFDQYYFYCNEIITDFAEERNEIMYAKEKADEKAAQFTAHTAAIATAKAQEAKWEAERLARLAA